MQGKKKREAAQEAAKEGQPKTVDDTDAAEVVEPPAGADGPEAASANEKARNRWVSAGSGPALVVRGGGLEPP